MKILRQITIILEDMHEFAGEPVTYVANTQVAQAKILESTFHWGVNSCTPDIDWMAEAICEGK